MAEFLDTMIFFLNISEMRTLCERLKEFFLLPRGRDFFKIFECVLKLLPIKLYDLFAGYGTLRLSSLIIYW